MYSHHVPTPIVTLVTLVLCMQGLCMVPITPAWTLLGMAQKCMRRSSSLVLIRWDACSSVDDNDWYPNSPPSLTPYSHPPYPLVPPLVPIRKSCLLFPLLLQAFPTLLAPMFPLLVNSLTPVSLPKVRPTCPSTVAFVIKRLFILWPRYHVHIHFCHIPSTP